MTTPSTPGSRIWQALTGTVEPTAVRDLLAYAYGPGPRGGAVNTRAAADALGVSVRTVQRWVLPPVPAPPSRTAPVGELLAYAYGPGPRGGAVNTRAAADALGVSVRTVQRWLHTAQPSTPSAAHLRAIRGAVRALARHRPATPSPEHLRQIRSAARAKAADRHTRVGGTLRARGWQGPRDDPKYKRHRYVEWDLGPEELQAMLDEWIAAVDDTAAWEAFQDAFGVAYGTDGWSFGDSDVHLE